VTPPRLDSDGRGLPYHGAVDRQTDRAATARRFRQALDLMDAGISMQRAHLRREHPEADDAEIRQLFRTWLLDRPPDCPGPLRPMPPEWRCTDSDV
jgi:hypothetical protein